MSQQYDNTNKLSAWKNMDKRDDKSAAYTGTLNVEGTEYFVDIWVNEITKGERSGQKMLNGRVKLKTKQGGGSKSQGERPQKRNQDPDDIPW
jgi:hypothetical protein